MHSGTRFSCDLLPARALNSKAADVLPAVTASVEGRATTRELIPMHFFNNSRTSATKWDSVCEKLKLIILLLGRCLPLVTHPSAQYRPRSRAKFLSSGISPGMHGR